MALSTLTGACWAAQRGSIPGFAPVPEDRVVLVGARDLEPYQRERLERSAVRRAAGLGQLAPALDALRNERPLTLGAAGHGPTVESTLTTRQAFHTTVVRP